MKQIIKAIWKSKEAPRDENFLWLKFEEGTFNLYTKGQTGWEIIKGAPREQLQGYTLYSNQVFNLNNIPEKPTDGNKYFIYVEHAEAYNKEVYIFTSDPNVNNGDWNHAFQVAGMAYGKEDQEYYRGQLGRAASVGLVKEICLAYKNEGTFTESEFGANVGNTGSTFSGDISFLKSIARGNVYCPVSFKFEQYSGTPASAYYISQRWYTDSTHWGFSCIESKLNGTFGSFFIYQDGADNFVIKFPTS